MHQTGFVERLAYGMGDLASNFSVAPVNFFIIFYYSNVIHVNAAAVGTVILISMLADSVFDVIMGIVVDKTNTRMGKARPWIFRMCIPLAVIFILLFSVPEIGETGKIIYVFVTYLLYNLIYSATNIPYGILNTLITNDQYERSVINIYRTFMAYGTMILVSCMTLSIVNRLGGDAAAWRIISVIYAFVALGAFLFTFFFTKERPVRHIMSKSSVPVPVGLKALFKNKYWLLLVLFAIINYIVFAAVNSVTVYFAQVFLHNSNLVGLITVCFYIPVVAGMFFLAPFILRFGKRNLAIAGLLIAILGSLLMLLNPRSLAVVLLGNIFRGIGMIPVFGTFFAMVADTIEYGHWKTGVRTEGLVYSASSFGIKMGSGFGAALVGWALALSGYVSGTSQPPQATGVIWLLYLILPAALYLILIAIMWRYKLDKLYPAIIAELDERRESEAG